MNNATGIVRREALVSAAINAALSAAFFLAVFGTTGPVPVRGPGAFAFDFLPQSLAIGIMAALVPALLLRGAIRRGQVAGMSGAGPATGGIVRGAIGRGLAAMVVGGGLCAALLWIAAPAQLPYLPALVGKVLYGAMLGALVTRVTLAPMVRGG